MYNKIRHHQQRTINFNLNRANLCDKIVEKLSFCKKTPCELDERYIIVVKNYL